MINELLFHIQSQILVLALLDRRMSCLLRKQREDSYGLWILEIGLSRVLGLDPKPCSFISVIQLLMHTSSQKHIIGNLRNEILMG
jgi:hypothetical protein